MDALAASFLDQGLMGATIVALATALIVFYRENKKLQEKLYSEVKETAIASINAQNAVANSITVLTDKIETTRGSR